MNKFTIGDQPCNNYSPERDGNGYGEQDNQHQCIYCAAADLHDVTVSFCESCHRDHHAEGYESCCYNKTKPIIDAKLEAQAYEKALEMLELEIQ